MISSTLSEYGSTSNLLPGPQQALPGYGGLLCGFSAKPEDRFKAVLMLVAAYDLPV